MSDRGAPAPERLALPDEAATLAVGARLGRALDALADADLPLAGLQVHLHGPLGAGKTTLVRGLLRALGVSGAVKSPTYTLLEPYALDRLDVYHFDLYRVADPEELELIGMRDHFRHRAVCLFEWPERGLGFLPHPDLVLDLQPRAGGRSLGMLAGSATGERLRVAAGTC